MSTNRLYDAWFAWLVQVYSGQRVTWLRATATLVYGMYMAQSVHLSKIAAEVPGQAKLLSQERRLSRLLDNPHFQPQALYAPLVQWWLRWIGKTYGELVLVLDGTKVSANKQLLMVAVPLKRRALPVAWQWIEQKRGHSSTTEQLELLRSVQQLLPGGISVTVVGDSEFGSVALIRHLEEQWHWNYVLRQKSNNQVRVSSEAPWQNFDTLVTHTNADRFVRGGWLTSNHAKRTNLLAFWGKGQAECWLLASNLPTMGCILKMYEQRMLIEQMFGDFKGHGFNLEHTRLRHVDRLNRLVFCVALLYVWLIRTGLALDITGARTKVDRHDRRDLSLFQVGIRYVKRCIVNHAHFVVSLSPESLPEHSGVRWKTVR